MSKTELYSWRVDPHLKSALENAARTEKTSVAQLLDYIVRDWLHKEFSSDQDGEEQRSLHAAAQQCFGTFRGGDPDLASQAKEQIRVKISERYAPTRAH